MDSSASTTDGSNPDQLTGWKEIASYLGKSVRTVQRWERMAGLPVHRVQPLGDVIFAFRSELDAWRRTPVGSVALESPVGGPEQPALVPDAEPPEAEVMPAGPPPTGAPPDPKRGPDSGRPRLVVLGALGVLTIAAFWTFASGWGRADLAIVASPQEPQVQGQHFQLTLVGFEPTSPHMRWTRLPNGREEAMPPALTADQTGAVRWSFSTDCRTETGTHHIWMEDERSGRRSRPAAVVVLPNPRCDKPMPDLVAGVTSIDKSSLLAGDQIAVRFSIWNVGTAAAVETQTRARLSVHSTRSAVSDVALGDVATKELDIGASVEQSATWTIPLGTKPGVYYIWIVADNGSATIEPNSFNNFARSQAFVVTSR